MVKSSGQPLKIGFVLDGGLEEPDGIQQYILTLGNYYIAQGHSVSYLVAGKINYGKQYAISFTKSYRIISNGNVASLPFRSPSRRTIREFLSEQQFDVLHVQIPYMPTLGQKFILQANPETAVIGTYHVVPWYWYTSIANWLLGKWSYFSLKEFDVVLSVSTAAQRIAKRDFGLQSRIIPNTLEYNRFKNAQPLKTNNEYLTILFLGRLVKRKGAMILLKAVRILADNNQLPPFRVMVCGKGPEESKLKEYVSKYGLGKLVSFEGFISEELKPSYYGSADISVFPAQGGESFGIVLLEAMASGRSAVIAASNDGYRSVLKDMPEALFKLGDEYELAEKLRDLLCNPNKRKQLADQGSNFAKSFDVSLIGNQLLELYKQALIKKRC